MNGGEKKIEDKIKERIEELNNIKNNPEQFNVLYKQKDVINIVINELQSFLEER